MEDATELLAAVATFSVLKKELADALFSPSELVLTHVESSLRFARFDPLSEIAAVVSESSSVVVVTAAISSLSKSRVARPGCGT